MMKISTKPIGKVSKPAGAGRLSDKARHLVLPDGIVSTVWPSVRSRCNSMGLFFDEWQDGIGRAILARRADGSYAASVGGVQICIPRQAGKTYTIGALVMGVCSLVPGTKAVWTAHRIRTSDETFLSMKVLAEYSQAKHFVQKVYSGNGRQEVRFKNGSRILFGARESGFGRGLPNVGLMIFDEAQILSQKAVENMVPATNTAQKALVIYMGTPPKPTDISEVFTAFRAKALAGNDRNCLYVEFGADPGCDPDDREQWKKANPSYPHRTSEIAIMRMRSQLSDIEGFLREGLGIWDEQKIQTGVDPAVWRKLTIAPGKVKPGMQWCAAARFSADGSTLALARAGKAAGKGAENIHVELCTDRGVRPLLDGAGWALDYLVENKSRFAQIVVEGKSGAADFVDRLKAAGVPAKAIITPSTADAIAAYSMFDASLRQHQITHLPDSELMAEVRVSTRRKIGSAGGFGWASKDGSPVAGIDAVTLAAWAARTTKRRPDRKVVALT